MLIGGAASGGPPPSPMAALSGSAAGMGTAVGAALAQGASMVQRMAGMADALAQRAAGAVVQVETVATGLEAQLTVEAGVLVGTASPAVAGPLLGGMLAPNPSC